MALVDVVSDGVMHAYSTIVASLASPNLAVDRNLIGDVTSAFRIAALQYNVVVVIATGCPAGAVYSPDKLYKYDALMHKLK